MISNLERNGTLLLLLSLIMVPYVSFPQFYNTNVEASIAIDSQDGIMYTLTGSASNKSRISQELRYTLSVITPDSAAGTKKKTQEGRAVLAPETKKNVSKSTLKIDTTDRTIILLLIYDVDDNIIGKDRKILNAIEGEPDAVTEKPKELRNEDVSDIGEDGEFIMRGLVVEDTKTKAGNDFYDMFYSSYLANNINGKKIVKVEEALAIANNTQIIISVENEVVVQFFLNPRNQFLKEMAEQSIQRINAYFQNLENNRNQIIRY